MTMSAMLRNQLRPAIVMTLVLCVITGLIYPGRRDRRLRKRCFRGRRTDRSYRSNGRVVGSALIGQTFTQPRLLPLASVGGRERLRRARRRPARTRGRPTQARRHAHRAGRRQRREERRGGEGAHSVRHGDVVGVGARSGHLAGKRLPAGARAWRGAARRLGGRARAGRPARRRRGSSDSSASRASTSFSSTSRSTAPSRNDKTSYAARASALACSSPPRHRGRAGRGVRRRYDVARSPIRSRSPTSPGSTATRATKDSPLTTTVLHRRVPRRRQLHRRLQPSRAITRSSARRRAAARARSRCSSSASAATSTAATCAAG